MTPSDGRYAAIALICIQSYYEQHENLLATAAGGNARQPA